MIVLPNHDNGEGLSFATRLCSELERHVFEISGAKISITSSVGVAAWPTDGGTFDTVIAAANAAENQAKKQGGNRVCAAALES